MLDQKTDRRTEWIGRIDLFTRIHVRVGIIYFRSIIAFLPGLLRYESLHAVVNDTATALHEITSYVLLFRVKYEKPNVSLSKLT